MELKAMLKRVPTSYPQWSWNKSVKYKKLVVECEKLLAKKNATESQLISKINEYRSF